MLIPFGNKLRDFRLHVCFRSKVREAKALALEDTEPVFDLIHPGTKPRVQWKQKRECVRRRFCTALPCWVLRVSHTTGIIVIGEGIVWSRYPRKALNSAWRFRREHGPSTVPARVSKVAKRWRTPSRRYSCWSRLGTLSGCAGMVGCGRGRGCEEFCSSIDSTTAAGARACVYRSINALTQPRRPYRGAFGVEPHLVPPGFEQRRAGAARSQTKER